MIHNGGNIKVVCFFCFFIFVFVSPKNMIHEFLRCDLLTKWLGVSCVRHV